MSLPVSVLDENVSDCSFRYRMAQFEMVATTAVAVLSIRSGSVIIDANMHLETLMTAEEWAFAATQYLLSQPDDYFGSYGNITVENAYMVSEGLSSPTVLSPPTPPLQEGDRRFRRHSMWLCGCLSSKRRPDSGCRSARRAANCAACTVSLTSTATAFVRKDGRP